METAEKAILNLKMFLRTIWYFLNIVFCIFNVNNVINNKLTTTVEYHSIRLEKDHLSVCLRLSSHLLACEEARNETVFLACDRLRGLLVFIENRNLTKSPNEIVHRAKQLKLTSYFEFHSNDLEPVGI